MTNDNDWRLGVQHDYLIGVSVRFKRYSKWSESWEHDHCSFCWAKLMEEDDPNRPADALWKDTRFSLTAIVEMVIIGFAPCASTTSKIGSNGQWNPQNELHSQLAVIEYTA
jgi:hypothetical protein